MSWALQREAQRTIEALRQMAADMERPAEDTEELAVTDPEELLRRYAGTLRTLADRLAAATPAPTTPADIDRQFAGTRRAVESAKRHLGEDKE